MNILVVGGDTKGSWRMRGVQLGAAIGARVTAQPTAADWSWAEVVVLVKRAAMMWAAEARRVRVPVIWDVLDFWQQPEDNHRTREELIGQVHGIGQHVHADLLIGATRQMASDIGGSYLSHHSMSGFVPQPIRTEAKIVAYQGATKYLGKWFNATQSACEKLGLSFVVNPSELREADVLVSFRDGQWGGDVCRQWKSGIKYANAIVLGRPVVTQPTAAYNELQPVGLSVNQTSDLADAIRDATTRHIRELAYEGGRLRANEFSLKTIAGQYLGIIQDARKVAA